MADEYIPLISYWRDDEGNATGLQGQIPQVLADSPENEDFAMLAGSDGILGQSVTIQQPKKYKLYLPPGATFVSCFSYVQYNDSTHRVALRIGQPPLITPTSVSHTANYRIQELIDSDCANRNSGGYMNGLRDDLATPTQTGLWLYVNQYYSNSPYLSTDWQCTCNKATLIAWYNSITEWDEYGNPIEAVTPTVDPDTEDPDPELPPGEVGILSAYPSALSFGYAEVGKSSVYQKVIITNGTDATTTITVACADGFIPNWTGGDILSLATRVVKIVFNPVEAIAYNGYVTFSSGVASPGVYLSGTGLEAATNDNYISVHQPNGLKTDWPPGSASSYQVSTSINRMSHPDMTLKMFIPPGTTSIKVNFSISFNSVMGGETSYCSACIGDEPDDILQTTNTKAYEFWMLDNFTGYIRQSGGYLYILDDKFDDLSTGSWLYVNLDTESSNMDLSIIFNADIIVDQSVYSEWYFLTNFDAFGDPIEPLTNTGTAVTEYVDPSLDPGAVYPPVWPIPYPWGQKLFPYPFT